MGVRALVEAPAEVVKVNLGDTNAIKNALDEVVGKVSARKLAQQPARLICVCSLTPSVDSLKTCHKIISRSYSVHLSLLRCCMVHRQAGLVRDRVLVIRPVWTVPSLDGFPQLPE